MKSPSDPVRSRKVRKSTGQPLSPSSYALIALTGLAVGILLLVFFVYEVPQLVGTVQSRIFYLLLIPWGLACAAFLFGAMKSYASLTHHSLGNALELGGPVVIFCLVVIGGFELVPQSATPFELTVRPVGVTDNDQLVTSGSVIADWGSYRMSAPIEHDGLAHFRGLDATLAGRPVQILPQLEGYRSHWITCKPVSNLCDLQLELRSPPQSHVRGIIENPPPDPTALLIRITGPRGATEGHPDKSGSFDVNIAATLGDSFEIQVFSGSHLLRDYTETLGGYGDLLRLDLR
jgi:hypothetical protein